MTLARTYSAVVLGVQAHVVEVEAHISAGLPGLSLVGLPDTAMNEARDRVRAAVVNSGLNWPNQRITVGLSPAGIPKRGSGLDVAIALAILAADGQIPADSVVNRMALGELSLNGRIRSAIGALAAALTMTRTRGLESMLVGVEDAELLRHVPGLEAFAAVSLRGIVARLRGEQEVDEELSVVGTSDDENASTMLIDAKDMLDVAGQVHAKFALEVAAVGGHHVALFGRAGVGKTLLAERLPTLLPDLDDEASLEVTAMHQLVSSTSRDLKRGMVRRAPFVAPHHTASRMAIVGGGSEDKPTVGAVTMAHRGVMFLDEATEFEPSALDALREPLEAGTVRITRAGFQLSFPARFQLVLATNPCPCGNAMDTAMKSKCNCTPSQRRRYLARLSGPLLDRVDIRVLLEKPTAAAMADPRESSVQMRTRVTAARELLAQRLGGSPWRSIGEVPSPVLMSWEVPRSVQLKLQAVGSNESLRGKDRLLRLAWSLSACAGRDEPLAEDLDLAIELRATELTWAA